MLTLMQSWNGRARGEKAWIEGYPSILTPLFTRVIACVRNVMNIRNVCEVVYREGCHGSKGPGPWICLTGRCSGPRIGGEGAARCDRDRDRVLAIQIGFCQFSQPHHGSYATAANFVNAPC